ncbi:UNVERIFIED_CONTAM: anaphase-promoting complex subunit 3 [Acetivibrio alkalicellulosi]
MGFKFGKSIRVGKSMRLNVSKSGIGMSVGVKGARVGIGSRGIRQTYSIPGTGLSYSKQTSLNSNRRYGNKNVNFKDSNNLSDNHFGFDLQQQRIRGSKWVIFSIISLFLILGNIIFIVPCIIFSFLYYKSLKDSENNSNKLFNKALTFYINGNFTAALPLLQKSVEYFDSNINAHLLLALVYYNKEQFKQSIHHIDKYCGGSIASAMVNFIKSESLFEINEYNQAIKILQSFKFNNEEHDIKRITLMGKSFFFSGKFDIAIEQFKKAPIGRRNLTEDILECKYWLGVAYYNIDDKKKAKTQLAKVYSEDVNYRKIEKYAKELGLL